MQKKISADEALTALLDEHDRVYLGDDFTQKVMSEIRKKKKPSPIYRITRIALPFVACAVIVSVVIRFWPQLRSDPVYKEGIQTLSKDGDLEEEYVEAPYERADTGTPLLMSPTEAAEDALEESPVSEPEDAIEEPFREEPASEPAANQEKPEGSDAANDFTSYSFSELESMPEESPAPESMAETETESILQKGQASTDIKKDNAGRTIAQDKGSDSGVSYVFTDTAEGPVLYSAILTVPKEKLEELISVFELPFFEEYPAVFYTGSGNTTVLDYTDYITRKAKDLDLPCEFKDADQTAEGVFALQIDIGS